MVQMIWEVKIQIMRTEDGSVENDTKHTNTVFVGATNLSYDVFLQQYLIFSTYIDFSCIKIEKKFLCKDSNIISVNENQTKHNTYKMLITIASFAKEVILL